MAAANGGTVEGGAGDWSVCASRSGNFNYDRGYTKTLMPRYPYLVANTRVLIFSGDVDACVPCKWRIFDSIDRVAFKTLCGFQTSGHRSGQKSWRWTMAGRRRKVATGTRGKSKTR